MTISSLATQPTDGETNQTVYDAYIKSLALVSHECAAIFRNYGLLAAGSNTSLTVGNGSIDIVLNTNSAFAKGMYVRVFDPIYPDTRWMCGFVTDYVSGTKTLTVDIDQCGTVTGTNDAWAIEPHSFLLTKNMTHSEVFVTTGNGRGSTNTCIRRFTTTVTNVGTAVTYADSATLGASFTINETGIYLMEYGDAAGVNNDNYGISVNSSQLTTAVQSITAADVVTRINARLGVACAAIRPLTQGNVIRAHTTLLISSTSDVTSYFRIRKIV